MSLIILQTMKVKPNFLHDHLNRRRIPPLRGKGSNKMEVKKPTSVNSLVFDANTIQEILQKIQHFCHLGENQNPKEKQC